MSINPRKGHEEGALDRDRSMTYLECECSNTHTLTSTHTALGGDV